MGYTTTKVGGLTNNAKHHEIVCHSTEDIENLPTNPDDIAWGSQCLCISDGSIWILDEDLTWKQI